LKLNRRSSN